MPNFTKSQNIVIGGYSYPQNRTVTAPNPWGFDDSVAAAVAGAVSVRTDNDTGTVNTLPTGHGLANSDKVGVYWLTNGVLVGSRRHMTIGSAGANSVVIDGGSGDNLPIVSTEIILCKEVEYDLADLDIDDVNAFLLYSQAIGQITLIDDADAEAYQFLANVAGKTFDWDEDSGDTNPITGATVLSKARASHADTTRARDLRCAALYGG